ncbi:hypothetical protein HC256_006653 [Beauveria bassiana]|nr:hypothetical protein HC256_006653 [Beauveria bassiana]
MSPLSTMIAQFMTLKQRRKTLRTTAGSTETSSSITTGRSNRAADHEQAHAVDRHGSLPSRQISPLPLAGAGASAAELATEALDARATTLRNPQSSFLIQTIKFKTKSVRAAQIQNLPGKGNAEQGSMAYRRGGLRKYTVRSKSLTTRIQKHMPTLTLPDSTKSVFNRVPG